MGLIGLSPSRTDPAPRHCCDRSRRTCSASRSRRLTRYADSEPPAEKREHGALDSLRIVLEGPVAALLQDDHLLYVEELPLALGVLDAEERVGGSPHHERRLVQLCDGRAQLRRGRPWVRSVAVE